MAETLILDADAVNALARPSERGALGLRARAILAIAHERRALVRIPAPVLAEVYRGNRGDVAIDRLLHGRGVAVVPLTESIARRAGGLLGRARLGSAHAVDAFVVATAGEVAPAVIATADLADISKLSAGLPGVALLAL